MLIDKSIAKLAVYIFFAKVAFFATIYLAYKILPFSDGTLNANFAYNSVPRSIETAFKTWDGQHYHAIADSGYITGNMNSAFYPLYPLLIKTTAPFFNDNTVVAGVFISNTASFLAYLLFFLFFRKITDEKTAFWGTLLMLSYPVAFYTNILYTEAIFLLLTASLFWSAIEKKWSILFLSAFLLPLTRPQGIMVALPYALFILQYNQWDFKKSILSPHLFVGTCFCLGFGYYLSILYWETGNAFAGFEAQKHFISGNSLSNLSAPIEWFKRNFINIKLGTHGFTNSWIDRSFFFFFLLTLIPIGIKLKNMGLLAYAVILGLLPALAGSFMSYSRYTLIIFPIFFALALTLNQRCALLIIIFMPLQTLFAIRHCLNYWQG